MPPPQLEYIHHSIDWVEVKYRNRNYFFQESASSFFEVMHLTARLCWIRMRSAARQASQTGATANMTNSLDSSGSSESGRSGERPAGWIKLGAVAAASVLAGGLVAAWWYRKTLSRLRQAEDDGENPQFGIPGDESADEG